MSRSKIQLVGVMALLIASQYDEINPMEQVDLVNFCDRAYAGLEVRSKLLYCIVSMFLDAL